tara:strand:+ start:1968 stop:2240 length:273 start_codon:yes stop_codon:yes gene_type:complete
MPSEWSDHVKKYASEHNVSYKSALTAAKETYKKKEAAEPRKKRERKKSEEHEPKELHKAEKKDKLVKKDKQEKRETAAESLKPRKMKQLM